MRLQRPTAWLLGCLVGVGAASAAGAAPLRIAVASFDGGKDDWRGAVVADELADRLSQARELAVTAREHVAAAESGRATGVDAARLQALGHKLGAELVIGGRVDGERISAVMVEVSTGAATPLGEKRGRPDRAAAELAGVVAGARKLVLPTLPTHAGDESDAIFSTWERARALADGGRLDEARRALGAAAARDARTQSLAAYLSLQARDFAGAVDKARLARTLGDGPAIRLMVARAEDWAGHNEAAVEAYRQVLALAPNDAAAHSNLGRLLSLRHDPGAGEELRAALASEPSWVVPAYNLALDDLAHGRVEEATRVLGKLHDDDPKSAELTVALARGWRRAGRSGAALPLLQSLIAERATDVGARAELALSLSASGQPDDALKLLAAAPRPAPALSVARGRVLLDKGALDDAALALEPALKTSEATDRRQALEALALVRLQQNRAADAARLLKTGVDEDPSDGEAQYNLALALRGSGDLNGAKNALRAAVAGAPELTAASLALGSLLLEAGDAAGALAVLEPAVTRRADDARLQVALGLSYFRAGQPARAAETLERASILLERADRTSVELRSDAAYDLCEALLAARRHDDARAAARRYLALEKRPGREAQLARARQIAE